jgi:hypothetical protein
MSFVDAIRTLNGLKRRRIIRDYIIIGAVAATAYMEPVMTQDLDVVVLVDTDQEFWETYRRVGKHADGLDGMHHMLGARPVQLFPSTMKPIYADAIEKARRTRAGNLRVKLASPEHLVLLALDAFRLKDKIRIGEMLNNGSVDRDAVRRLLEVFDDGEHTLARRFKEFD